MKSVPLATAAQIYHRFFQETELQDYEPHVSIYKGIAVVNVVTDYLI